MRYTSLFLLLFVADERKMKSLSLLIVFGIVVGVFAAESKQATTSVSANSEADEKATGKAKLDNDDHEAAEFKNEERHHFRGQKRGHLNCKCPPKCRSHRKCYSDEKRCHKPRHICLMKGRVKCVRYKHCRRFEGRSRCHDRYRCKKQRCRQIRKRCFKRKRCVFRVQCEENHRCKKRCKRATTSDKRKLCPRCP